MQRDALSIDGTSLNLGRLFSQLSFKHHQRPLHVVQQKEEP